VKNVLVRYEEHPVFDPPEDLDATIWRYLDFTKLVALLDTGSLYFARADQLGDDFEGSYSRGNVELRPALYREVPPEHLAQLTQFTEAMVRHSYLNCWSLSAYENAALWGLYVPPHGGVAIRSTFRRLTECFLPSEGDDPPGMGNTVHIGRVRYADYERDFIPEGNTLWPFVHKRRSYEFEQEVRACIQDLPTVADPAAEGGERIDLSVESPLGRAVQVDLQKLVEAIHVSPVAPTWLSELVESVCARYGLDKPVTASSLASRPVY
jgi:hypothetical protein